MHLCDQVIEISEYRTQLYNYLKNRMMAIAPNTKTRPSCRSRRLPSGQRSFGLRFAFPFQLRQSEQKTSFWQTKFRTSIRFPISTPSVGAEDFLLANEVSDFDSLSHFNSVSRSRRLPSG